MEESIIDLDLIEDEDDNSIDDIMSSIERYALEYGDIFSKEKIERKILYLERTMQDAIEEGGKKNQILNECVKSLLKEYLISLANDINKRNIDIFSKGLDSLIQFSKKGLTKDIFYVDNNNAILSPVRYLKSKGIHKANFDNYLKAATISLTHFDIVNSNWVHFSDIKKIEKGEIFDSWDIDLIFDVPSNESHKPLEFVYQFIEILNLIYGVQVELKEITVGSLKVKLKTFFDNVKSKEEVKELLESSKKFAKGKLEKDFEESERSKKEGEKLEIEKKLLLEELQQNTSIENAYKRSLEIQSAEEDLKRKKLENTLLQIDILNKGTQALAELLANKIISQTQFELLIKGLPFIRVQGGKMLPGESLDVIDNL